MHRIMPVIVAAALLVAGRARAGYDYRAVDYPGASKTLVLGVNDRGQFVGLFVHAGPHAMVFDGQALAPLDPGGPVGTAPRSRAYAINDRGAIVGSYSDPAGQLHGFLWDQGVVTTIDYPGGLPTEVYGINNRGQLVGVYYDAAFTPHGFSLAGGRFQAIDVPGSASTVPYSINDRGTVVGEVVDVAGTVGHGYRQRRDGAVTRYDAPGAPPDSTYFISINDGGEILGGYYDLAFDTFNFILDDGVATPFDLPASFSATAVTAETLNDRGDVVGSYVDAAGKTHGFVATVRDP